MHQHSAEAGRYTHCAFWFTLAVSLLATGCSSSAERASPKTDSERSHEAAMKSFEDMRAGRHSYAPYPDPSPDGFLPAKSGDKVVLVGSIEHKGWTKTAESEAAGGSDYYVLVVSEDAPAQGRRDRHIMRCTPTFPTLDHFKPFAGKRVELVGRTAGYYKYKMPDGYQRSVSLDRNGYALHGGGLLVDAIKVIP